MANLTSLERMTPEQRVQALVIARAEAEARGLMDVEEIQSVHARRSSWRSDKYFVKSDGTRYSPTQKHEDFIASDARFVGFFGARGSGKTVAGAQRALLRIEQGRSGAVMNPDFENFRFSTWPELVRWIPWHKVHRSRRYMRLPSWEPRSAFTLPFVNGARLVCKGLKDPESGRGPNLNFLWYDEGGRDRTGMSWNIAIAGVRVGDHPSAWVTTTPKGRNHWLHNLFIKEDIPQEARDLLAADVGEGGVPLLDVYHGTIKENKDNLDSGFYASMVAAYGGLGWLRQQELDGLFVDAGGGMVERAWFTVVDTPPMDPDYVIRYWDLAATVKEHDSDDPDYTVGARVSWKNGTYFLEHVVSAQIRWNDVKSLIFQSAKMDGFDVPIVIEQEPGASGKSVIEEFQSSEELIGYEVWGDRPEGDKLIRANPWFAAAAQGRVKFVKGEWNGRALDEIAEFPDGMHDDIVDAISGAVKNLSGYGMEIEASVARLDRDKWSVGGFEDQDYNPDHESVNVHIDRDRENTDASLKWTL